MPTVLVVLVRHGERLDEADPEEWRRVRTEQTRSDPPLTATGIAQSRAAGAKLTELLRSDGLGVGDSTLGTVYCSPTQRTADTAVQVALELRAAEITPHHALNCCAAAKRYGVENVTGVQPKPERLHGLRLACWPPAGDIGVVNQRHRKQNGFVESCTEFAGSAASLAEASGMPCLPVVLVTHREAIWELQDAAAHTAQTHGLRYQPGRQAYCSVEAFDIDPQTGVVFPHVWGASVPEANAAEGGGAAARSPSTINEVLAAGRGQVLFHRPSGDGGLYTKLWVTPGVRGVWVPGVDIPNGEIVELLTTPQQSDGDEGEFVRIRRPAAAAGQEGWTKVKNIHLIGTTFA